MLLGASGTTEVACLVVVRAPEDVAVSAGDNIIEGKNGVLVVVNPVDGEAAGRRPCSSILPLTSCPTYAAVKSAKITNTDHR